MITVKLQLEGCPYKCVLLSTASAVWLVLQIVENFIRLEAAWVHRLPRDIVWLQFRFFN